MDQEERILRKPELIKKIGLSDVTIWRMEKSGNFPKRFSLGGKAVGWLRSEVEIWINQKVAMRDRQTL